MSEEVQRNHTMTTRSMSNKEEAINTKPNARAKAKTVFKKNPKPVIKHVITPKTETNKICSEVFIVSEPKNIPKLSIPLAEIFTEAELKERGLIPNASIDGWRKVIPATELDILVTAGKDVRCKWALAPEGWYWKAFSEKSYFWFDWFELREIQEK
jgi:hypothetical protein